MKNAIVLLPVRGKGYAFGISFPKKLVESFRALFVRQEDRSWQNPLWCFKRRSLETVRTWAKLQADGEQLLLFDTTQLHKAEREKLLAEIWQKEYEEHVVAMEGVLPLLPPGVLRVSHWGPTHLILDLQSYLDRPHFDQLQQAAFPEGKVPRMPFVPSQNSADSRFYAVPDPRILHTLMSLHIRNFQVQELSIAEPFENGTVHLHDQEERLWFGAPFQKVIGTSSDFMMPEGRSIGLPYTVVRDGKEIYLVVLAETYLHQYCVGVASPLVSALSPKPSSEMLTALLQQYHLEAWLQKHVSALCEASADALTPASYASHADLWQTPSYWSHPADTLLHFLQLTEHDALLRLLGWDNEQIQAIQDHAHSLKVQHTQTYYQYCETNAVLLLQDYLRQHQRAEIQEMASRYGITLLLWKKEKMIQACTDPKMAADFVGITEEQQRRQKSDVAFIEGIPWGKRESGDLYRALRRGYLSNGAVTLGAVTKEEGSREWYVVWERWPPRVERARHQWSPTTLIEQEGIDLQYCRWFAYPGGAMPAEES